jgi:ubiquinone/menaquinone biosynthesis C-methylase UbiE
MEREFLNPKKILEKLNLKKDLIAADFGSGSGGWAIPLAKILEDGKVYAIDILEEPLSALKSKAKLEGISNIELIKNDVEKGVRLLSQSCDLVLMTNLLFECEEKKKVLEEGKRVLKKGGKLLIVDWKKESKIGPAEKVPPEEVKKMAEEIGFKLEEEFEAGPHHYGLLFSKL